MLTLLALGMLATFMILVMSGRVSVLIALILVPIVFGLLGGFGGELGPMMLSGIEQLAPTAGMLCFAILYFCIMSDAGLFDPLISRIVRIAGNDPVRIVLGTAVLALIVSLDGDGATTYLICCAAFMPIYRRIGLNPLILACLLVLACGITNITPWGGPTATVASALAVDTAQVFVPLLPGMLAAAIYVLALAYFLGLRERKRLAAAFEASQDFPVDSQALVAGAVGARPNNTARPKLLLVNLALTAALLVALVSGALPLAVLFMIAASIALLINYPALEEQKERLAAHAPGILRVIAVIFAAGIFVGILNGSGMAEALARPVTQMIPPAWGAYSASLTGLAAIPFGFFMANKAFFFGVVPVLSEGASHYGVAAVDMARASLVGQPVHLLCPTVPSTYLLVALAQVEFGALQRFALKWAVLESLILLGVSMATGAFL